MKATSQLDRLCCVVMPVKLSFEEEVMGEWQWWLRGPDKIWHLLLESVRIIKSPVISCAPALELQQFWKVFGWPVSRFQRVEACSDRLQSYVMLIWWGKLLSPSLSRCGYWTLYSFSIESNHPVLQNFLLPEKPPLCFSSSSSTPLSPVLPPLPPPSPIPEGFLCVVLAVLKHICRPDWP